MDNIEKWIVRLEAQLKDTHNLLVEIRADQLRRRELEHQQDDKRLGEWARKLGI